LTGSEGAEQASMGQLSQGPGLKGASRGASHSMIWGNNLTAGATSWRALRSYATPPPRCRAWARERKLSPRRRTKGTTCGYGRCRRKCTLSFLLPCDTPTPLRLLPRDLCALGVLGGSIPSRNATPERILIRTRYLHMHPHRDPPVVYRLPEAARADVTALLV